MVSVAAISYVVMAHHCIFKGYINGTFHVSSGKHK
jgi:hypothetical protein